MSVGLVLSGGGAKGSFEIGALQRLYELGFFAEIISGSSAGAISAAKLAEGGKPTPTKNPQKDAFEQLRTIWNGLRTNDDMFEPQPWFDELLKIAKGSALARIEQILAWGTNEWMRATLLTGQLRTFGPSAAGKLTTLVAADASIAPGAVLQLLPALLEIAQQADRADLIEQMLKAESLYTLDPTAKRLNIPSVLDPAAVAKSGVKLRMATVSLETSELRYVDGTGAVFAADALTPYRERGAFPPQCQPIEDALKAKEAERDAELEVARRDAIELGARAAEADAIARANPTVRGIEAEVEALRKALDDCLAGDPLPQLTVPLAVGIRASASIPAAFPPVLLGREHYVDGGVREIVPVDAAVRLGATHIIAVSASPMTLEFLPWQLPSGYFPIAAIAGRSMSTVLGEIAASDVLPGRVAIMIAPRFEVHDTLVVERGLIRINMAYGYMCADDALARFSVATRRDPLTGDPPVRSPAPPAGPGPSPLGSGRVARGQIDLHALEDRELAADIITRLRVAAWRYEQGLLRIPEQAGGRRPVEPERMVNASLLTTVRTLKGVIRHVGEARLAAGSEAPAAGELEEWWGAWELHSSGQLSRTPWDAHWVLDAEDSSAVHHVSHGGTTWKLDGLKRRQMSAAALAKEAPAKVGQLSPELLALFPVGPPLT